jgi:hypothetical protein
VTFDVSLFATPFLILTKDLSRNPAKDRSAFLKLLYEKSAGNQYKWFDFRELGKELELDEDTAFKVADYLAHEGLLKWQALGGILGITHFGIKQSEERKSFLRRWKFSQAVPWLILAVASWGIGQILDRGVPVLANSLANVAATASTNAAVPIPLWEYRTVSFLVATPILYFGFNSLFRKKLLQADKSSLLYAALFSAFGIFVLPTFFNNLLGR